MHIHHGQPSHREVNDSLQQSSSDIVLINQGDVWTQNQESPPKIRRNTTVSIFRYKLDQTSQIHKDQLLIQNTQKFFAIKNVTSTPQLDNYPKLEGFLKKQVKKIKVALNFVRVLKQFYKVKFSLENTYQFNRISILPFYPDDIIIQRWKIFIDIITFSSVILYPIYICYDLREELYLEVIIIQIIFCCDIVINCLTSYIDQFNNLVIDYREIIRHYLRTSFILDSVSSLPLEKAIDAFIYLKMLRVIKYFLNKRIITYKGQLGSERVIENFNPHNIFQLQTGTKYFISVLINAFLLIHIFGCWEHFFQQTDYITSVYWSSQTITTLGYGDVHAKYELAIIWMIVGVGFCSFTFGNYALFSHKSKMNEEQELIFLTEKMTQDLPEKLKYKCHEFIKNNLTRNPLWIQEHNIMITELFYQLKNYLAISSLLDLCIQIPFFLYDINYTQLLLLNTRFIQVDNGQFLYREGESANEIFFLLKGDIRIMTKDKGTLLYILEGTMFGEFEAIEEKLRGTYCVAQTPSQCIVIPFRILRRIMSRSQIIDFEMKQLHLRRRKLIIKNFIEEKRKKLQFRRQNVRIFSESFLEMTRQEYEFEKSKSQFLSIQQYNGLLLQKILGKKRQRFEQLLKKFKRSVYRIIEMNHLMDNTPPDQWKELNNYQLIKRVFPKKYLTNKNQDLSISRNSSSVYSSRSRSRCQRFSEQYFVSKLPEIRLKHIVLNHLRNKTKKYTPLSQIVSKYQNDPEALNFKRRHNLGRSRWNNQVSKTIILRIDQIEDCGVKYFEIMKSMKIIESIWLKGSMQKFELFQQLHFRDQQ